MARRFSIVLIIMVGAMAVYAVLVGLFFSCGCTTVLVYEMLTVVDRQNQAIDGVDITVTNKRTGQVYAQILGEQGTRSYPILSNAYADDLNARGEQVLVTARHSSTSVTQEFVFGTDRCHCHIRKLAGPDTLILDE